MSKLKPWPFTPHWKDIYEPIKLPPTADNLTTGSTMLITNSYRKIDSFIRGKEKKFGVINFNPERTSVEQTADLVLSWYVFSAVLEKQGAIYAYLIDCGLMLKISLIAKCCNLLVEEIKEIDEKNWKGIIILLTTKIRLPQLTGIWTRFDTIDDLPKPVITPSHVEGDITPELWGENPVKTPSTANYRAAVRAFTIPVLRENKKPNALYYGIQWYRTEYENTLSMIKLRVIL